MRGSRLGDPSDTTRPCLPTVASASSPCLIHVHTLRSHSNAPVKCPARQPGAETEKIRAIPLRCPLEKRSAWTSPPLRSTQEIPCDCGVSSPVPQVFFVGSNQLLDFSGSFHCVLGVSANEGSCSVVAIGDRFITCFPTVFPQPCG